MHLEKLNLTNFKNYEQAGIEFSPRINCFVGNNGVGKTNILDAIHYISLTKSFFNNIDSISIRHSEDYFIISGSISREGETDSILCTFQKHKQKVLKKNGKEYQKLSDHVGRYPVVMISPADSTLITEGSEERRKFMNKIISQYNHEYLDAVLKYGKALQQRNRLLKDFGTRNDFDPDSLEVWNAQLVKHGTFIFNERKALVNDLVDVFREYYRLISSGKEEIRLVYKSQLFENDFRKILENTISKDRILEYTTSGIHKDDLLLEMNGHPVRILGSQGQQKSYLVALKLAKFEYIARRSGQLPILLLDDIFDKFDAERVEQIIRLVGSRRFGQIFITDTHRSRLHEILTSHNTDYRLFMISNNNIEVLANNGSAD
jgi:DNA replication and repair protein RecF